MSKAIPALLLLLLLWTGCAMTRQPAGGAGKEARYQPETFTAFIGGPLGPSYRLELRRGRPGNVTIDRRDRSIVSRGSNAYPRRDGVQGGPEPTPEFSAFLSAVGRLIGGTVARAAGFPLD